MIRTAISLIILSATILCASAGPSVQAIETAMNLIPGRSITFSSAGKSIEVTYQSIEARQNHEYAIIVEVR